MQKAIHPESKTLRRICDTCYSEMIKSLVINHYKFEQDRLKSEIFNFQKRMEMEKFASEKDLKSIEELNRSIDDTKSEINHRELTKTAELTLLKHDIQKIDSDYEDISSRLQLLQFKNLEITEKIMNSEEQNKDFLTADLNGIKEKIEKVRNECEELSLKLKELKNSQKSQHYDLNFSRILDEIKSLKLQKGRFIERIQELKSVDAIKESNISMLLSNLSNASTCPEVGSVRGGIEDEEIFRNQENEIFKLSSQLEKIQRKNVIENQKCVCFIF
jgi:hypothetical protein